jgi:hypothetical protein
MRPVVDIEFSNPLSSTVSVETIMKNLRVDI